VVLFNFDLRLLAIQVTASIISTSEFDHDTERRKTGTETCIARLGVVLHYAVQSDLELGGEKLTSSKLGNYWTPPSAETEVFFTKRSEMWGLGPPYKRELPTYILRVSLQS
jgi:hypothetical protein